MNVSLRNDYSQPALNDPCPMSVTSFYTPTRMFIVEQQLEQHKQKERIMSLMKTSATLPHWKQL